MVTMGQARDRAERWVNGDVPAYQRREVRLREFDLGYVAWAEDREGGPSGEGGLARMVIARSDGRATLWPALPVDEVIRQYQAEYGSPEESKEPAEEPAAPRRSMRRHD